MISTGDFKNGKIIVQDGELMEIVEFQHVKPGKGGAFVRTKLRNALTGRVLEKNFRAGERMEEARLEEEPYQFIYSDGDVYHFMHRDTYEQTAVGSDVVGDKSIYLKENCPVGLVFYQGKVLMVNVPVQVDLQITECAPGVQGDRSTGGTKSATLETGAVIQVPLFLNEGDVIKVDTRTGQYIERVS